MWLLSTPAHCLFSAPALQPHPHSDTMKMCCSNVYLTLKNLKKKFFKIFLKIFGGSDHLNSTFRCAETVRVRSFLRILWGVWTTTTTTVVVRTLLWCGNSLLVTVSLKNFQSFIELYYRSISAQISVKNEPPSKFLVQWLSRIFSENQAYYYYMLCFSTGTKASLFLMDLHIRESQKIKLLPRVDVQHRFWFSFKIK